MFSVSSESNKSWARTGRLETAHGKVTTPLFLPVATKGAAKLLSHQDLEKIGAEAFIANAFLLSLRPGIDLIEEFKGLHKFLKWDKCIFTDSGGFQILNEEMVVRNSLKGVVFKSPFDGSNHLISPEQCIKIQNALSSDIAMVLDDVPHYSTNYLRIQTAVKRTKEWAKRCLKSHANDRQLLFCIAQGGIFKDLRAKNIADLKEMDFDGMALGGLCIGESKKDMIDIVRFCSPIMPPDKPRYLMGVGSPEDVLECIGLGMDVFDSCFPTRLGRHGVAFTSKGRTNFPNTRHLKDPSPLDEKCGCFVCKNYSKAYLNHLFKAKEFNALMFLSYHNIHFLQNMVKNAAKAIEAMEFIDFKNSFLQEYNSGSLKAKASQ